MPAGAFLYPKIASFYVFKLGVCNPVPAGVFLYPKIAPLYFFGGASVSPGLEGNGDGGDGGGGRISGQGQARYSNAPRDQISCSGNPLTSIIFVVVVVVVV